MTTSQTSPVHAGEIALGAMYLGTRQDRDQSFAILDRFVDLGGRWIDTADNYAFWEDPTGLGGRNERLLGEWLAARPGIREQVWISTKAGAAPTIPHRWPESMEGLSPAATSAALDGSLERLGTDRVELFWAHVEDRSVPLEEQVAGLAALVADGRAAQLGASNHAAWRVERARRLAADAGVEPFTAVQLRHTYLQPVPFVPLPDGGHVVASPEALDFVATEGLAFWVYSSLLMGAYARDDRPFQEAYRHPDTERRLAALDRVSAMTGATRNQIVLAWLMQTLPRATPIVGVSSIAQLEEAWAARDLTLDADALAVLDLHS